jgi:hypothetical protein
VRFTVFCCALFVLLAVYVYDPGGGGGLPGVIVQATVPLQDVAA